MFQNYFKIAWRNLSRQKIYSIINITGMTIGMTCFILLALYIQFESNYDIQHEKLNQIYRVAQTQAGNEYRGTDKFAVTPLVLGSAMEETFPEVEITTTLQVNPTLIIHNNSVVYERGLFADKNLFDVFTYPVLKGVGKEALTGPESILLTEKMAKKYFKDESPIGKTLSLRGEKLLTVKGILQDIPSNQHFTFDFITSVQNYPEYPNDKGRWGSNNYRTYFVLKEGHDYKALEKKLSVFDEKINSAYRNAPFVAQFFFQPLKDIHLHSQINFEAGANGDMRYIYLSASIAFIILLLALINYMNLATARAGQRAKEVGVRKVLGARKRQLIGQFMAESVLVTLFSFALALSLANLLLPLFNDLMDMNIPFDVGGNQMILAGLLVIAISMGVLSGLYPAIFSSTVAPVNALKGNWFKSKKRGSFVKDLLVVGQFTTAIVLAIGSMVVYQQMHFIQNKKLGYNREQVVFIPYLRQDVFDKTDAIRNELLQHPQIEKVSFASYMPLNMISQGVEDEWEGNSTKEELYIYRNYVDYDFLDLFEIELAKGRNFSPDFGTDTTNSYILNEAAVKKLGWDEPLGKSFAGGKVIGVVKDFHFQPFDLAIEPMWIRFLERNASFYVGNIALKIKMDKPEAAIAHIQQTLKTHLPQMPFEHQFMDDSYNSLYEAEQRFGQAFNFFTFIALFIACMGLFGLVTHHVLQRTKEIGIRKVLGATVTNIVSLISKDFLKLVFLSAFIAIPIAWWLMNEWLTDFAYRIEMDWWVFAFAGIIAILVAFLTVSSQSVKAALANPVEAIKSE